MKKVNAINIVGKGYNCIINFNNIVYCYHNTNNRSASVKLKVSNDYIPPEVEYFDVEEINYLDE